ncbi:GNAT family N-acetyltransferase [Amnibacterium endophyticum]|uniref:GNAT family N-acetyltransferase n=1 Tax=Amnibacterium endophyticum TaxID=2109337 RepID=A0ABW4LGI8_9MICO
MAADPLTLPVDDEAQAALAAHGLRMELLDPGDDAQVRAWMEADSRGFHDAAPDDATIELVSGDFAGSRTVAVRDDSLTDPRVPVGTITSWPAAMTVPGGEVTGWAISGVTVAPTHRRRGIARAMVDAELRAAVAAELPVAILTVSEATIYTRYGFGPAAWTAALEVQAKRAGWLGAETPGRVQLVERATAMETARELLPAARRATPGDVQVVGHRFDRLFGSRTDEPELRRRRFVRYDDEDGVPRGLAVYVVGEEDPADFTSHVVEVRHLATTTDDAYRALWRYLLELDLVRTVRAPLRSTDEPLRWLVRDQRAIRTTELREHLWVRVLDPVAAFSARTYGASGRLALRVTDPAGYADGSFVIHATEGFAPRVARAGAGSDVPTLELPVDLLGSLYLGGVSAVTLARAGRITEVTPGAALAADRLLRGSEPPLLATWF